MSERELLDRYREFGNQQDLATLYAPYMDMVFGVCLQYFKKTEDAQDSVSTIYEELVVKLRKHQVDHFKAWLHQVTRNHCLMALRKKKLPIQELQDGFMQSADNLHLDDVNHKEGRFNAMETCLETLPENQKSAIRLFYLQEKCYQEIAEITGFALNMVKSYIQNGRRNLKICIENLTANNPMPKL
jgi:RNA polymerase sigma-70 factor (ECF subfamily)